MPAGRPRAEVDESTYAGRFAAGLRRRRDKAGLLLADVAREVNVATVTVYQWEAGSRSPRIEDLPALAKALGCSVRALMPAE